MLEDLMFWLVWPARRRRRYLVGAMIVWVCLWVAVFAGLSMANSDLRKGMDTLKTRYERVRPLAREVLELQSRTGQFASLSPLAAAQQVGRELKLEEKLASVRPKQLGGGQEGVQLLFEALNLGELLDLLQGLGDRGGLKVMTCNLIHRLDNPKLVDLQLVLAR